MDKGKGKRLSISKIFFIFFKEGIKEGRRGGVRRAP